MTEKKIRDISRVRKDLGLVTAYNDYRKRFNELKDSLFDQVVSRIEDFEQFACTDNGEFSYFSSDDFYIILTPDEFDFIRNWKKGVPYVEKK